MLLIINALDEYFTLSFEANYVIIEEIINSDVV